MESLEIQQKAINLGKQLVAELRREPDTDTLCRWMAHYVAEQIVIAENTTGAKKVAAETKCFQTILALWKHRATLPNGHRPFEDFEPIFQALASLDPDKSHSYYHHIVRPASKQRKTEEPDAIQKLINLIFGIDSAARILIDAAMSEITEASASERTKAILKDAFPDSHSDDVSAIHILIDQNMRGRPNPDDKQETYRQIIQDRLDKLEAFSATCSTLQGLLRRRLKSATTKKKNTLEKNFH
jgi:hypothetical protein